MTVAAILQNKGGEVVQIRSTDNVLAAVRLLSERRIGCVPVVDDGQVVGIFSERDLVYKLAEQGPAVLDQPVASVMTAPAITISQDTAVMAGLSMMTQRRIRHLPVVQDGAIVGLVSIGDLVKYRIDRIESEAASMRDYIQAV
jgi:CBS domain-containing protein